LYTTANLYGSQVPNVPGGNAANVVASGVAIHQNVNPYSYQIGIRHSF